MNEKQRQVVNFAGEKDTNSKQRKLYKYQSMVLLSLFFYERFSKNKM